MTVRVVVRLMSGRYKFFEAMDLGTNTPDHFQWPSRIDDVDLIDHTGSCALASVSERMILYREVPAHDVPVQRQAHPDAHLGAIETHEYDPGWVVGDASL